MTKEKPLSPSSENTSLSSPASKNGLLGLFLVFLGFVLLLNNLQIVPWTIWQIVWRFWPVFLILIGLQSLLGKNRKSYALMLLLWLILLLAILLITVALVNPDLNSYIKALLPWFPLDYFSSL